MNSSNFDEFVETATGSRPFPFQRRFAEAPTLPQLVHAPTGLGKTAMAVIGWLWRRFGGDEELRARTPRRLVYCLPMRVLVEQTRDCGLDWLDRTGLLAGTIEREPDRDGNRGRVKAETYRWDSGAVGQVGVHVLLGGEEVEEWDIHPEREAIIIGTQDMLVSRGLNRGYAASRSRWPIQFGLLNTDCLWVFDEIQLMGAALATTAQLEAFRRLLPCKEAEQARNGHGCRSVWMSATMQREWLETVDFKPVLKDATELTFDFRKETRESRLHKRAREILVDRWTATKQLHKARAGFKGATIDQGRQVAQNALVRFFLGEYKPTLIVGPWAGGSGFFRKDNKEAVQELAVTRAQRGLWHDFGSICSTERDVSSIGLAFTKR